LATNPIGSQRIFRSRSRCFRFPARLLLPGAQLPLNIFEPRYLAMFDDALSSDRVIGIIQPALEGRQQQRGGQGSLCCRVSGPDHVLWRNRRWPLRDHAGRHLQVQCARGDEPGRQALPGLLRLRRSVLISTPPMMAQMLTGRPCSPVSGPISTPTIWKPTGVRSSVRAPFHWSIRCR
jgi:hypothetical protein